MISTVILTKNEEKNIEACIKSVRFSEEIIVIDNGSDDDTVKIAQKLGANVIDESKVNDFSTLRNRGLKEAKNQWVLFIDADERISDDLKEELLKTVKQPAYLAYYIKRRDHWWGRMLQFGEVRHALTNGFIRLVSQESGTWSGSVHEVFQTEKPIGSLQNYLDHYPHPTLHDFICTINHYSSLRAKSLHKNGVTTTIFEIAFVPFFKFIYTYFILLGFLDGVQGFTYSFCMSFHSFLVRSKLYIMKS